MKKGSITVFLALILSLILSLVCTSMESVRMAAARTQILNSLDIGLYSLFGQYDRELFREYDLFFLNVSGDSDRLGLSSVYDNMEAYMKPVLKQNSQKLSVVRGGFSGYRLATDQKGEVLYRQIVQYMKKTSGVQGIQKLAQKLQDSREHIRNAEQSGTRAEENGVLENYDAEMNAAAVNSEAAAQQEKENGDLEQQAGQDFSGDDFSDGQIPEKVVNPIPVQKRIRKMGLLDLIVPAQKGISEKTVKRTGLLSGRRTEKGMAMTETVKTDNSYTSQLLFQQYLTDKLGSYGDPAEGSLAYQQEYLLCGKYSDRENLQSTARRLLMIREGINAAFLMTDPIKQVQIQNLALAIASAFLVPPAAVVIEAALLFCWSFGESILDLRELFHGGKIALIKTPENWKLSLNNLADLLQGLDSQRKSDENGLDYETYLQILLASEAKAEKLSRSMDMMEICIRSSTGQKNFRLDHCIEAIEAAVDVRANRRKIFTVKKQFSYI